MNRFIFILFSIIYSVAIVAQESKINFRDFDLEAAIQIAQIEDKNIFIDTYTPWCGPCKRMDIVFQDPDLSAYFNKNYLNIKINMDSSKGPAVKNKYDVIFLPTMLILDKWGNVKHKSEGPLSPNELLALAKHFISNNYNPPPTDAIAEVKPAPNTKKKKKKNPSVIKKQESIQPSDVATSGNEKILFTADNPELNNDPNFLYNYAYLKLKLQDGTQYETAEKYLKTQKDWKTKKNLEFIYDFVRTPDSPLFTHIVQNRSSYDILFGPERVNQTIGIIVNMKLYNGFPRPDLEEAIELFSFIDPAQSKRFAYEYMLDRYNNEEKPEDYIILGKEYLESVNPGNFEVMYNIAYFSEKFSENPDLDACINLIENAIELDGNENYKYYEILSELYTKKGKKNKATHHIDKAISFANNLPIDHPEKTNILARLETLKADIDN